MTLMLEPWSVQWWLWMAFGLVCLVLGMRISTAYLRHPKRPPAGLTDYNVYRSASGLVVRSTLSDAEVAIVIVQVLLYWVPPKWRTKRGKDMALAQAIAYRLQPMTPHKVVVELA